MQYTVGKTVSVFSLLFLAKEEFAIQVDIFRKILPSCLFLPTYLFTKSNTKSAISTKGFDGDCRESTFFTKYFQGKLCVSVKVMRCFMSPIDERNTTPNISLPSGFRTLLISPINFLGSEICSNTSVSKIVSKEFEGYGVPSLRFTTSSRKLFLCNVFSQSI